MNTQEQIIFNTANRLLAGTKTAAICIELADGRSAYLGDDAGVMRMLQNKDQSGAAVRGEAVAESNAVFKFIPTMTRKDEDKAAHGICPACKVKGLKLINTAHGMSFFQCNNCRDITVLASARAADAPSEPSELLYNAVANIPCDRTMSHFVTLAELRAYKEGHHAARHAAVNLVAAFKSRAADALDSQPTVPAGWILVPIEPTDAMYFAACHAFTAWRYTTTEQPDFTHRDTYRAMLTAVQAPPQASSQPTDGGVRNG